MIRKVSTRQCTGCREMKPKNELIRIIRTPDNEVCLDSTGKKNGRGAYICMNTDCYNKAVRSKAIERALDRSIPDAVYEAIGKELKHLG